MDPAVVCKPIEMKSCHEDLGLQIWVGQFTTPTQMKTFIGNLDFRFM